MYTVESSQRIIALSFFIPIYQSRHEIRMAEKFSSCTKHQNSVFFSAVLRLGPQVIFFYISIFFGRTGDTIICFWDFQTFTISTESMVYVLVVFRTKNLGFCSNFEFKVHIFWEGHKIWWNLHPRFDCYYIGQIYRGDFTKFCGPLWIYELYQMSHECTDTVFMIKVHFLGA